MIEANLYQAPESDVYLPDDRPEGPEIKQLISGQKLVIYALLAQFIAIFISAVFRVPELQAVAGILSLVTTIISFIGVYRVTSGLGAHIALKILSLILMLIPLISLIFLLVINGRATKALRTAGYKVGLMGARV